MRSSRTFLAPLLVAATLALATPATLRAQSHNRDIITREELQASAHKDADIYSAIRAMRPHFMRPPRGVRTLGNGSVSMGVYVDGVRESGFEILKGIPVSSVLEVRYQDPSTAESDHGREANGGAVMVKRMKPGTEPAPCPPDR